MTISESDIQGNIIKAYARPHSRYLFLRFTGEAQNIREGLQLLAREFVTSAEVQAEVTADWRAKGMKRSRQTVGMLGVSFSGLDRLQRLDRIPSSDQSGFQHFRDGMRKPQAILWEPEVAHWQSEYLDNQLDAFLLLCDDDEERLGHTANAARSRLSEFASVAVEETGARIYSRDHGFEAEPFGFRDGVSGIAAPESVFTAEHGTGFGCFAVFAKFEQDVEKFRNAVKQIADAAAASSLPLTEEEVGGLAVGRLQDGTPLADMGPGGIDDFSFEHVSERRCPAHAHIRSVNPRDGVTRFPMMRRGIPYPASPTSNPGLLFLSLQAGIKNFLGTFFMSRKNFDPILARSTQLGWIDTSKFCNPGGAGLAQRWPAGAGAVCSPLLDLVTLRGGEYFYIPSMPFLSSLA